MPLNVDTITLIKEVIACFNDLFFIFNISAKKSNDSVSEILNISLRINSSTKVLRSYGAI